MVDAIRRAGAANAKCRRSPPKAMQLVKNSFSRARTASRGREFEPSLVRRRRRREAANEREPAVAPPSAAAAAAADDGGGAAANGPFLVCFTTARQRP